jgi:hypothetical protein
MSDGGCHGVEVPGPDHPIDTKEHRFQAAIASIGRALTTASTSIGLVEAEIFGATAGPVRRIWRSPQSSCAWTRFRKF